MARSGHGDMSHLGHESERLEPTKRPLLVDVEELSYEEAATVLACPVGTLRSRLARARRMLFTELRDYARTKGFCREAQD